MNFFYKFYKKHNFRMQRIGFELTTLCFCFESKSSILQVEINNVKIELVRLHDTLTRNICRAETVMMHNCCIGLLSNTLPLAPNCVSETVMMHNCCIGLLSNTLPLAPKLCILKARARKESRSSSWCIEASLIILAVSAL